MNENCCPGSPCCCSEKAAKVNIPVVSTSLSIKDMIGGWKVRWNIGRMNYSVEPGLYAVGKPDGDSPVFVSANYKLSFDTLRANLSGLDCWILTLDTKGVNVWCAAGKGTFGTEELVNRIEFTKLSDIVTHRKLILPQLGASGVRAFEVEERTGFSVVYGPVRANDIKAYISSGYKATRDMRTVNFTFRDRLAVTPVELVEISKKLLPFFGILFLLNLLAAKPFDIQDFTAFMGAVLCGTFFMPILLPFIPGSAFSLKGWLVGLCWTMTILLLYGWYSSAYHILALGYLLLLPSLSAYLGLKFTGCSTYTSPSGVLMEMRIALPPIAVSSFAGAVLALVYKFI